ncbi:MAG TPA: PH domain-containing protein [Thermoanaerobaculia bacterium]|nr:PH domain-containing protein [Thermoanaerobaculia bacterium]
MVTPDLAPDLSHPEPAPEPPVPSIADGVEHRLDPRVVQLDRIAGWIFSASISLGLLVVLTFVYFVADDLPGWAVALLVLLWVIVTLILAWSSHRWPAIEHRHASYKVDERGIEIRRGVYWRRVIHVPRSRVQHTDVSQGPIERGFGLGTLVIYTAGTDHARVDLPGLEHATALQIRDYLLPDDEDAG